MDRLLNFFALPNFGDDYFIGGGKVSVIKSFEPDELDENNESASEPQSATIQFILSKLKFIKATRGMNISPAKNLLHFKQIIGTEIVRR